MVVLFSWQSWFWWLVRRMRSPAKWLLECPSWPRYRSESWGGVHCRDGLLGCSCDDSVKFGYDCFLGCSCDDSVKFGYDCFLDFGCDGFSNVLADGSDFDWAYCLCHSCVDSLIHPRGICDRFFISINRLPNHPQTTILAMQLMGLWQLSLTFRGAKIHRLKVGKCETLTTTTQTTTTQTKTKPCWKELNIICWSSNQIGIAVPKPVKVPGLCWHGWLSCMSLRVISWALQWVLLDRCVVNRLLRCGLQFSSPTACHVLPEKSVQPVGLMTISNWSQSRARCLHVNMWALALSLASIVSF